MAFNLSAITVPKDSTYDVHLTHPSSGELLYDGDAPVVITIFGKNSKAYRDATTSIQKRRFDNLKKKYSPAQMEEDALELLAAVSFEAPLLEHNGKVVKTALDFKKLYADDGLESIRKQVDSSLDEVANFLK